MVDEVNSAECFHKQLFDVFDEQKVNKESVKLMLEACRE